MYTIQIIPASCHEGQSYVIVSIGLRQTLGNAHVRSKQNVRDKGGPLVDNAGNIITQGFLMA